VPDSTPQATRKALISRIVPAAHLGNTTYGESIEFLRQTTGVNIVINWPEIASFGRRRSDALKANLSLHDVAAGEWLDAWCEVTRSPEVEFGWELRDGLVVIGATRDGRPMSSQQYRHDVRDLLVPNRAWERVAIERANRTPEANPGTLNYRRELLLQFIERLDRSDDYHQAYIDSNGFLILNADDETQNAVEQILDILRHPADHGSPP
jgi:hypothetical protein